MPLWLFFQLLSLNLLNFTSVISVSYIFRNDHILLLNSKDRYVLFLVSENLFYRLPDSEPPEILNCPNTINTFTDKISKTAVVTWSKPTALDNSGSANISQTRGLGPGSTFRQGLTEIRYRASDANSNTSPECIFFINVEGNQVIHDIYNVLHCFIIVVFIFSD